MAIHSTNEGIGQGRITDNLGTEIAHISGALHIPDEKSIEMLYRLLDEEGLYLGASSALNVVAAVDLAKKLGPGESAPSVWIPSQFGAHSSSGLRSAQALTHPCRLLSGKTIVTILCDGAYR